MKHELNFTQAKEFLFAGKAIVTFQSITGKWFTYKINKNKKSENDMYFVSVLTGKITKLGVTINILALFL